MKKLGFLALTAMVMMGVAFASCDSRKTVSLKTEVDSVSYIIGAIYGRGFSEDLKRLPGTPGNVDALVSGFISGAGGDSIHLGMDMATAQNFMSTFFQGLQAKEMEVKAAEAEGMKAEAVKFLAENGVKSGVITTENGLQYKVLTEGKGPRPKLDDVVKIHYHGTLIDGSVFESSVDKGEPIEHPVSGFIEGWKEGLQIMPVGSKYLFWIPSSMAYDVAGPNHPLYGKLLIFEVQLLEIVKK